MSLRRGLPMLWTVLTLTALAAPAAADPTNIALGDGPCLPLVCLGGDCPWWPPDCLCPPICPESAARFALRL